MRGGRTRHSGRYHQKSLVIDMMDKVLVNRHGKIAGSTKDGVWPKEMNQWGSGVEQ